jgi:two-component system, HptB-dependent secretion and biofilm response regulator
MIDSANKKILCVDDEQNVLHMFRRTLGRHFNLLTASSGDVALELLAEHNDIAVIISDYNMPCLDGVEFLKLAKKIVPDSVQIMLTGNIQLDVAIKTINETSLYRYLPKPFPTEDLQQIVNDAINQYQLVQTKQLLTAELEGKNSELADINKLLSIKNNQLELELDMAKNVYKKVYDYYGHNQLDGLDYLIDAKDTVGGDFLLTYVTKDAQSFYLMMGDVTGHGLQSALAVLLITEVFDSQCRNNPNIEELLHSINERMRLKLPTGLFCAAIVLKLDVKKGLLQSWQGGLPEAFFLDKSGGVVATLPSTNLPLGILESADFSDSPVWHDTNHFSSIFLYTDGLIDQINHQENRFGTDRLLNALLTSVSEKRKIDFVEEKLRIFQQDQEQCDDISMVELDFSRLIQSLKNL